MKVLFTIWAKSRDKEQRQRGTKEQRNRGTKEQRNKGTQKRPLHPTKLDEKNNPNYLYNQFYLYLCGMKTKNE